jgi:phospholipase C
MGVRSASEVHPPRSYTLRPHKQLTGTWEVGSIGLREYDLSVHGPNGFVRGVKGSIGSRTEPDLALRAGYDEDRLAITLVIANKRAMPTTVRVQEH